MSRPTFARERALWRGGHEMVAGLDEVGRGPLAGPVVAAAVVFRPGTRGIRGLRDSKQLTAPKRERVATLVRRAALACAVGAASVREIDRINIRRASALAMRRAVARLRLRPDHLLVDGNPLPELGTEHESVIRGDQSCQSIAAASVLAKCVRDRLMQRLAQRYPAFRWDHNKGYATAQHLAALADLGPTPHHRISFAPIGQFEFWWER